MPQLKTLFLFLIFSLSTQEVFAQVDTAWVRRYNGPGNLSDNANAIALDNVSNVYVTGYSYGSGTSYDYATIKYNSNGDTLWVMRYNGPGNADDGAYALAVDSSGNVYVTGTSIGSGTSYDYATIKYNSNGDTLWVMRYNGPGNADDGAYAMTIDDSGNVYVTGYCDGSDTSADYATIKYDSNGNTLWVRRYNGPGNSDDKAYALAIDSSGNVYVTGASIGSGTSYDYVTIKYDSNGDTRWVGRYNGPLNSWDMASALAVDGSGNVYVTGYSFDSGTSYDYATIKYDSNGDILWVRRYNGPLNSWDKAYTLAVDGSGNVYVTGYSYGSGASADYATIKYDSNGDTLWVRWYNGPLNSWDMASALAVDGLGNVYVTGISTGSNTGEDYATIKYRELFPDTLVGYWKFDEGSETIAYDSSGYSNDGTLINGPAWVEGRCGKALSFDGADDYVAIPDLYTLSPSAITVMAWIKSSFPQTSVGIIHHFHHGEFGLGLSGTGIPGFGVKLADGQWYSIESPTTANVWHHVAGVWIKGDSIKFYVDGIQASQASVPDNYLWDPGGLQASIGSVAGEADSFFPGSIDEVKVYSRALSEGEIKQEYEKCKACSPGDFFPPTGISTVDSTGLRNYLFHCGTPPDCQPNEANGNCELDFGDLLYLRYYLQGSGPAPIPNCSIPDTYFDPGYPDTIKIDTVCGSSGDTVNIPVYVNNDEEINLVIPLKIDTTRVFCDTIITTGTRGAGKIEGIPKYCKDSTGILLYGGSLPPGSGIVAYLRCKIKEGTPPGFVEIDSTFLDPNKLRFFKLNTFSIKPIFIRGGVDIKPDCEDIVSCSKSHTDPCIKICPAGDVPFNVYLKDNSGNPMVGYSNVWLDFSGCPEIDPCSTQTQWPLVYPVAPSNDSGIVTFYISAGGCNQSCSIPVRAGCGNIAFVPVKTLDNDGNLFVNNTDFNSSYGLCRDYNCKDSVDYNDYVFFKEHMWHSCTPPNTCLLIRKYLRVEPDTALSPGKTTKVDLIVQNTSVTNCIIDRIEFYYSGSGALDTLMKISTVTVGYNLSPGDSLVRGALLWWIDSTTSAFYARFYTDCCSSYIEEKFDLRIRQCPPLSIEYKFPWHVFSPMYTDTLLFMPSNWSWSIDSLNDTCLVTIRTSDLSPVGTKGSVTLWAYTDPEKSNLVNVRTFEVFVTLNSGDATSDCRLSPADLVYIINFLFKHGPAPNPLRVADTNCDGRISPSDLVFLINYLFKHGPNPPCNE